MKPTTAYVTVRPTIFGSSEYPAQVVMVDHGRVPALLYIGDIREAEVYAELIAMRHGIEFLPTLPPMEV